MKKFLTIRKFGLFYNTFDDDAKIINYLFGYRIINGKCGFSDNALNKVINTLEDKKINYMIMDGEEIKRDFKNLNKYELYLARSINKTKYASTIDEINDKIDLLEEEQLYKVLDSLKELVNEQ